MNRQSLFVRTSLAVLTLSIFVVSFALPGTAAAAAPLLGKSGLRKAAPVVATVALTTPIVAENPVETSPQSALEAFSASVVDGRAGVLRGVYVPGVLALRVVQQAGAFSVNMTPGLATQYSAASAYGVTGLLADNVASGVEFYGLSFGQEVTLIYGDGTQRRYMVDGIASYQALSPTDPYSDFLDLGTGAQVSATALFAQMYSGGDKVTFQTCLAKDGLMSWGRLFVTAHPVP